MRKSVRAVIGTVIAGAALSTSLAACGASGSAATAAPASHSANSAQVALCEHVVNAGWNDANSPLFAVPECAPLSNAQKQSIINKLVRAHGGN